MNEAIIILLNMRGGCATVGDKVHTLFRVTSRRAKVQPQIEQDGILHTDAVQNRPSKL